ncbi:MAG: hypothetical protein ACOQNV_02735 [Mycoplasmoidaceae bacterium]
MKKIKLFSSLLSLSTACGMIVPAAVSCSKGEGGEDHPVRKQCQVSLSEECAEGFVLGVTKIPEGHTLLTSILCKTPHYCDLDGGLDVTVQVGDKTLEKDVDYQVSSYDVTLNQCYYWTLAVWGENVIDDIVISIDVSQFVEVFPIQVVVPDRLFAPVWADPIPVDDIRKEGQTNMITIHCSQNYFVMPDLMNYPPIEIEFDPDMTSAATEPGWNFVDSDHPWLFTDIQLLVNFGPYDPDSTLTIMCELLEQDMLPNVLYEGHRLDGGDPVIEGEDFEAEGSLAGGEIILREIAGGAFVPDPTDPEKPDVNYISFADWCIEDEDYEIELAPAMTNGREWLSFKFNMSFYLKLFDSTKYYFKKDMTINFGFQ